MASSKVAEYARKMREKKLAEEQQKSKAPDRRRPTAFSTGTPNGGAAYSTGRGGSGSGNEKYAATATATAAAKAASAASGRGGQG
ncbi:unnamed protein product, partial [Laminaria digitata]